MSSIPPLLPTGEGLARDERMIREASFRRSNVAVWSRVDLAITNKRLVGVEPYLFLGVLSTGSSKLAYPLPNIASVAVNTRVWMFGLIGAIPLALMGLFVVAFDAGRPLGVAILALVVVVVINVFRCDITISNNGGQSIATHIAFADRGKASTFVQEVSSVLTSFAATPAGPTSPSPGSGESGPAAALVQLTDLKNTGLITPEEFDQKRGEILSRL